MSKKTFRKYQTLFKIVETDEDGEPVKVYSPEEFNDPNDPNKVTKIAQWRTQYTDAPTVDLIPDLMHRIVTEEIMKHLDADAQVRFDDIAKVCGAAFTHARLDYIKQWIENHADTKGQPCELLYVNRKYWTVGKGDARSDDLEIAQSYLAINGRDKQGWVVSAEGEEGNEQITRARINWQLGMAAGLMGHVGSKLAGGSGKPAEVKALISAATGTLSAIESK